MYEDDCCHYTDLGYEILAEVIANRIRDMKRPTPAAPVQEESEPCQTRGVYYLQSLQTARQEAR